MARPLAISKIFQLANDMSSKEEQAQWLKEKGNGAVVIILKYALDNVVKWNLPDTDPPYKVNLFDDQEGMLHQEARRLYLFINDSRAGNLTPLKREKLYIDLLEAIHPEDAKMLLKIKNKEFPYPNISIEAVNMAFPGLIVEPIEHPKVVTKKKGKKKKDVEVQPQS